MKENRKKLKSIKYRILFALCLSDIISSLWLVFWSLPIPKGTPGVWGAMGNKASCNAQGFFFQFAISGSFYNAALALYYYKSLCSSMKDEQIAKRYEKWIHIVSIVFSLATATAAWQQDLFSFSGVGCFYAPEPLRCHRRDGIDCIRGDNAYTYLWLYSGIPDILLCIYITYAMWMIYMKVKEVSRKADKWSIGMVGASTVTNPSQTLEGASSQRGSIAGNDNQASSRYAERTKEAASQAFLYVNAYVATRTWAFLVVLIEQSGGTSPFFLVLLENLIRPLQGFVNVFIFLRPRIKSIQKSSPEMYYFTATYHSVFHYDEVRQRATESVLSPVRPDEERRPKSGTTHSTAESLRKATGEECDAFSTPATHAGINESRHDKEDVPMKRLHPTTPQMKNL